PADVSEPMRLPPAAPRPSSASISQHTSPGLHRPEQDRDRIGLVVVGGLEPAPAYRGEHGILAGVALARGEAFDGADRNALIGDALTLAPSGQRRQETAVDVGGVSADMAPDLLEIDRGQSTAVVGQLFEPVLEAQVAHAAAVVAAGAEAGGSAVHDPARQACPARGGAEIQGENGAARGCRDDRGRNGRALWEG